MQVMVRIENEWVRCGKCGHKLFKMTDPNKIMPDNIQIKCHSCKVLNVTNPDDTDYNTIDD